MILTCPSCAARFLTPDERFGDTARKVKCGRCAHTWMQAPPPPVTATAPPARTAVEAEDPAEFDMERAMAEAMGLGGGPVLDQSGIDSLFDDVPARPAAATAAAAPSRDGGDGDEDADALAALDALLDQDPSSAGRRAGRAGVDPEEAAAAPAAAGPRPGERPGATGRGRRGAAAPQGVEPLPASFRYGALEDAQVARARRQRRQAVVAWATVASILLGLSGSIYLLRNQIAQAVPATRQVYQGVGWDVDSDPTGLTITGDMGFSTAPAVDGRQRVTVQGAVRNDGTRPKQVPQLVGEIENSARETVFRWSFAPAQPVLAPGEAVPFSSTVETPARDIANIYVTFDVP